MILKKNLEKLLRDKNISISQLSIETGVPKSNLSKWLSGANPKLDQLSKVADYFNISVDELAFNKKRDIEDLFQKLEVHTGLYEVTIKKVSKK